MAIVTTTNGAKSYNTTNSACYDLFALGAAYRDRGAVEQASLFHKALNENAELAMKTLFWIRNVRGGAGERQFFRTCMKWLAGKYPMLYCKNLENIAIFGRWDDLIDIAFGVSSSLWNNAVEIIKNQLINDMTEHKKENYYKISLLAKWMPSENASSTDTIAKAKALRRSLGVSAKAYRKMLSTLRKDLKIIERDMSLNNWDDIDFSRVPSKAFIKYNHMFINRPELAERYADFIQKNAKKVNSSVLFPYDIVHSIINADIYDNSYNTFIDSMQAAWDNLPNYCQDKDANAICVVDTSGSMAGRPMETAVGLGIYCAERLKGNFHNYFITFSERPSLIKINESNSIVDKINQVWRSDWGSNTNLIKVFDLLYNVALKCEDKTTIPEKIIIISDMQIDYALGRWNDSFTRDSVNTEMAQIRNKWDRAGLKMPKLVYWNVNAIKDTILDIDPNATCVSGSSAAILKTVLAGKTGYDVFLDTVLDPIYDCIYFGE